MFKNIKPKSPIIWIVLMAFIINTICSQPVEADVPFLPPVGQLVSLTPSFSPSTVLGLKVYKNNPFKFQFLMSEGDSAAAHNPALRHQFLKSEASKLVKYFLASLTIPEKDMWVNLSPNEPDRITPMEFGITEMGKEMLAQDYLLKQVTSSLMYPEGQVGQAFWKKIYEEAYKRFGTTDIAVNTFNKVWIVPDKASVYENTVDNTVVILDSKLKVMLEEDYLLLKKSGVDNGFNKESDRKRKLSNETIRQVIVPLIEKEVNTGKNFGSLRQVYNALILAFWFKSKLKSSLISQGYVDRKKVEGVSVTDKEINLKIYKQYLRSFKKGVYNYIKEEIGPDNIMIPRKYFSGGMNWLGVAKIVGVQTGHNAAQLAFDQLNHNPVYFFNMGLKAGNIDLGLLGEERSHQAMTAPVLSRRSLDFMKKALTGVILGAGLMAGPLQAEVGTNTVGLKVDTHKGEVEALASTNKVYAGTIEGQLEKVNDQIAAIDKQIIENNREISQISNQVLATNYIATQVLKTAKDKVVVDKYKLTVPNNGPIILNSGSTDSSEPPVSFVPDNVAVAYIDYQLATINKQLDGRALKVVSPVHLEAGLSYNQPFAATPLEQWGGTSLNIVPSLPMHDPYSFYQSVGGLSKFGAQTIINQVGAPLFGTQALLNLRNYLSLHGSRFKDILWDPHKTIAEGIFQTLAVDRERAFYFEGGNLVQQKVYTPGLIKTLNTITGKIDRNVLGDLGIVGNGENHFVINNSGFQIEVGNFHKAFDVYARFNTDPNVSFINAFEVDTFHNRYRKNSHGIDRVLETTPKDPDQDLYLVKVDGLIQRVIPGTTNTVTIQDIFTGPDFVPMSYIMTFSQSAEGTNGVAKLINRSPNIFFMDKIPSILDLQLERQLALGRDSQGNIIWGILRNGLTGHIVKLITNPQELLLVDRIKDKNGEEVRFVPFNVGKSSGHNVFRDYAVDELSSFFSRLKGVFVRTDVKTQYSKFDISERPYLTQLSSYLKPLVEGQVLIFESSRAGDAVFQAGQTNFGVVNFVDGRPPAVLMNKENLSPINSPKLTNVTRMPEGFMINGLNKIFSSKTLVFTDGTNAIGVVDPSARLAEEHKIQLLKETETAIVVKKGMENYGVAYDNDGKPTPFVEKPPTNYYRAKLFGTNVVGKYFGNPKDGITPITDDTLVHVTWVDNGATRWPVVDHILDSGRRSILDRQLYENTLKVDGFEVPDYRQPLDPETQKPPVIVFTKDLTGAVQDYNRRYGRQIFAPLSEFKTLGDTGWLEPIGKYDDGKIIWKIRAVQGPIPTPTRPPVNRLDPAMISLRLVVLAAVLNLSSFFMLQAQNLPPQTVSPPGREMSKLATLTGPDGKAFFGVTIDTSIFTAKDIPNLNQLGVTAIRTYQPIPLELATKIIEGSKVRTFDIGIPLNGDGYSELTQYWGGTVPRDDKRISLEGRNYIPYLQTLTNILGVARVTADLGNENNLHKWYGGRNINSYFEFVDARAEDINQAFGGKIITSYILGDKREDFTIALSHAPHVNLWLLNYYSHNGTIQDDLLETFKKVGFSRPVAIGEAGTHSKDGEAVQERLFRTDWQIFQELGLSCFFMSFQDNPNKSGGAEEGQYGLLDPSGRFKPAAEAMRQIWQGQSQGNLPVTQTNAPVTPQTQGSTDSPALPQTAAPLPINTNGIPESISLENLLRLNISTNGVVRYPSTNFVSYATEIVKTNLDWEPVKVSELNAKRTALVRAKALEILAQIAEGPKAGDTVGRFVYDLEKGYELWLDSALPGILASHVQILFKNGTVAYLPFNKLRDSPGLQDRIRREADTITMMGLSNKVTVQIYLNANPQGSRVEFHPNPDQEDGETYVVPFLSFDPSRGVTRQEALQINTVSTGANGIRTVGERDLRPINKALPPITNVYQLRTNQKPVLISSDRPLEGTRIYYRNGLEYYAVFTDETSTHGRDIIIDGKQVKRVASIAGDGYYVNLSDLNQNAGFAFVQRIAFDSDGKMTINEKGFVRIDGEDTYAKILEKVRKNAVLTSRQIFTYNPDGTVGTRPFEIKVGNQWTNAWSLSGGNDNGVTNIFSLLGPVQDVKTTLGDIGITNSTPFVATVKTEPDGTITTTYTVGDDTLNRGIFTEIHKGDLVYYTAGLDFDPKTGRTTRSLTFNAKGKAIYSDVSEPNDKPLSGLLSAKDVANIDAEALKIDSRWKGLDAELNDQGSSLQFIPSSRQVTRPFALQTDHPTSYQVIQAEVEPLVKAFATATSADRPALITQISQFVLKHQLVTDTHYTDQLGPATVSYPLYPNDPQGRDGLVVSPNGYTFNLWPLAGRSNAPINIPPVTIKFDNKGKYLHTERFKESKTLPMPSVSGTNKLNMPVNYYTVNNDHNETEVGYVGLGEKGSLTTPYTIQRVANGIFGVETAGYETMISDPFFAYTLPLYATWSEDGRIPRVTLNSTYSVTPSGHQKVEVSSLVWEPKNPGNYVVETQGIVDGEAVKGTLRQEDVFKGYKNDIKEGWPLIFAIPALVAIVTTIREFFRSIRLSRIGKILDNKLEQDQEYLNEVNERTSYPYVAPSFNSYGFQEGTVSESKKEFKSIEQAIKTEGMSSVLSEYFRGYVKWREVVWEDKEMNDLNLNIEDLWILVLMRKEYNIVQAIPSLEALLVHMMLRAKENNKLAEFGKFVAKEQRRFHRLNQLQAVMFNSPTEGTVKRAVPYQNFMIIHDINEMMRMKEFIDFYLSLPFTFDGNEDLRGAVYRQLFNELEGHVTKLRTEIDAKWDQVGGNLFRLKTILGSMKSYRKYVGFIKEVEKGLWRVPEDFRFEAVQANPAMTTVYDAYEVNKMIEGHSLMFKTFAESGATVGRWPNLIRWIPSGLQFLRNNYNQLVLYPVGQISFVILLTATNAGIFNWFTALPVFLCSLGVLKGAHTLLNLFLDRNLNTKYGKPVPLWAGYGAIATSKGQKIFRFLFWLVCFPLTVFGQLVLAKYFMIPTKVITSHITHYYPEINLLKLGLSYHFNIDSNLLLVLGYWTVPFLILYLVGAACFMFVLSFFGYIHGGILGIGTIRTNKDITKLQKMGLLERLIFERSFPYGGLKTPDVNRKAIVQQILESRLTWCVNHCLITKAEKEKAVREISLDHFERPEAQEMIIRWLDKLLMESPSMPDPKNIVGKTTISPVLNEDIVYSYSDIKEQVSFPVNDFETSVLDNLIEKKVIEKKSVDGVERVFILPDLDLKKEEVIKAVGRKNFNKIWDKLQKINMVTALDMMTPNGYTYLYFFISKTPKSWRNFIDLMKDKNIASKEELARMEKMFKHKGRMGKVSPELEWQIRLWASYEGQPFARTLDGFLNEVRERQLLFQISHPTMTIAQIREAVNDQIQIEWAWQVWGRISDPKANLVDQLKYRDALRLLKECYEELGFFIDIVSLQRREKKDPASLATKNKADAASVISNYKVISRYIPGNKDGKLQDVAVIEIAEEGSFLQGEGKPSNLMHALSMAIKRFVQFVDMNQGLDPFQAGMIPRVLREFENRFVTAVNMPEVIMSGFLSKIGAIFAFQDGTFADFVKRCMYMLRSPANHGHPDVVRKSAINEMGGPASIPSVSEDYNAGSEGAMLTTDDTKDPIMSRLFPLDKNSIRKNEKFGIIHVSYMDYIKHREIFMLAVDGIIRKFAMGAGQRALFRDSQWADQRFGFFSGKAEFYLGPHFYTVVGIGFITLLFYNAFVMFFGLSLFDAFPWKSATATFGAVIMANILILNGYFHKALNKGPIIAAVITIALVPFMIPYSTVVYLVIVAGLVTAVFGGIAYYVATGRGHGREHVDFNKFSEVFYKSHVMVSSFLLAWQGAALITWCNLTFILSWPYMLFSLLGLVTIFITNQGFYPGLNGVSRHISKTHYIDNTIEGINAMWMTFWDQGLAKDKRNYRRAFIDGFCKLVVFIYYQALNFPVQLLSSFFFLTLRGRPEYPNPLDELPSKETTKAPPHLTNSAQTHVPTSVVQPSRLTNPAQVQAPTRGGIDFSGAKVKVDDSHGSIAMDMDDRSIIALLLNAKGLDSIIDDVRLLTPAMASHFVGLNY